jgi:isoleucyl-tRNA synthetase
MKARHPWIERDSLIVLGGHVTLEAGTGAVHTAPGHGHDDYVVGLRYGLDTYAPVDDGGRFTADVPEFAGTFVFDADAQIIELLERKGALLAREDLTHSYPHCWRCKSPVIFRATDQWFLSMEENGLRERTLAEIERVRWIPSWGRDRIHGMIANRPDWVSLASARLGRSDDRRALPVVPADVHQRGARESRCRAVRARGLGCLVRARRSRSRAVRLRVPAVLEPRVRPLHRHCRRVVRFGRELRCGRRARLRYGYRGGAVPRRQRSASRVVPFFAAQQCLHARRAPYRAVLTHGFVLDGEGRKQSKSLGNVVAPQEVIKQYGADILRLWVSAEDYRDDVRISEEILKRLADSYRRVRNTARNLLANLFDFDPARHRVAVADMPELDRWALTRLDAFVQRSAKSYEEYDFHLVYHALNNFCAVDLSSLYFDIAKDRLYCRGADSRERRATQTVMYETLRALAVVIAPILSFTAEEIWAAVPGTDRPDSVFLADFPRPDSAWRDERLAARWERVWAVRSEVTKALEAKRAAGAIGHSLDARVRVTVPATDFELLSSVGERELESVFIVSQVEMAKGNALAVEVAAPRGAKCGRCWNYRETVGATPAHPEPVQPVRLGGGRRGVSIRAVIFVVAAVIGADRATKLAVMHWMQPGESIEIVPGFFALTFVRNPGAAFGMFAGSSLREPLLILVALGAVAGLAWLLSQTPASRVWERAAAGAIIGGALGNLYDRFAYGSVVDFLDVYVGELHWPAFNVADSCITVGVAVLLLTSLRKTDGDDAPATEEEGSDVPQRKAA